MTGRRKDAVWNYFISSTGASTSKTARVQCKKCNKELVALVARMQKHVKECRKSARETKISGEILSSDSDTINYHNQIESSSDICVDFDLGGR